MNDLKKYSLVAYLIGEEYNEVRALQKEISEITGSTKCLTDWQPHITIGDGPETNEEQLEELSEQLESFVKSHQPFATKITGFGGIENWKGAVPGEITPYVIWLNVEVSQELLGFWNELRVAITEKYPAWLPRTQTYVPHVTIAFADLTKEGYDKGMAYLASKNFESPLTISHIALVECYGVGNMTSKEYKRFQLGKNGENRPT